MSKKITVIENNKYKKNSKEFKLIEFLNNHSSEIIQEPINSISQKLNINTSTLTRIVRKIGFKNYATFRNFVVEKVTENKKYLLMREEINKTSTLQDFLIFSKIAVEQTLTNIEEKNFESIINEIVYAKRILLFGIGFSHSICHQLAKYFEIFNINSYNISDFYHAIRLVNNFTTNDVWIIISISLTTKETIFLLKEIALNKYSKTIVITSNDKHMVLKNAAYILKLKSLNDSENEIFNFNYKIALTAVASLLINTVINRINYDKVKQILEFDAKTNKWKK